MQFNDLESIIYLLGNVFRLYIISVFFGVFFRNEVKIRKNRIRKFIYISYFIINSAMFLYFDCPAKYILLLNIMIIAMISLTYEGKMLYRIIVVALCVSIQTVCRDMIFYLIIYYGLKNMIIEGTIASYLMFFAIVHILKRTVIPRRMNNVVIEEWVAITIIPIVSIIVSTFVMDNCYDDSAIVIGGMSLVLINILVFHIYDKIQKIYIENFEMNLINQQKEAYENQICFLNEYEERIYSINHDLKNHLYSIREMAEKNDSDSIIQYVSGLINETKHRNLYAETGNFIIDSFLNTKLSEAEKLGARIVTEFEIQRNINIEDRDISIVIGNLLDNSIEAISKCKENKYIDISIKEKPGVIVLRCVNSCEGHVYKKNNKFISTKRDSRVHGIGLENVRRVVEEYGGDINIVNGECSFSVNLIMFI